MRYLACVLVAVATATSSAAYLLLHFLGELRVLCVGHALAFVVLHVEVGGLVLKVQFCVDVDGRCEIGEISYEFNCNTACL
jgi:hypothetical protein